jgi:hypothetical protein
VVLFKRYAKTVWLTRRWELVLASLYFWAALTTSAAMVRIPPHLYLQSSHRDARLHTSVLVRFSCSQVQSPEMQTFLFLLLLLLSGSAHLLFAPFKNPSTNIVATLSSVTLSLMVLFWPATSQHLNLFSCAFAQVFIGLAFSKLPTWFATAIEVLVLISTTGVLVTESSALLF